QLWDYNQDPRDDMSSNAFRKRMKKAFLHYMRTRECFDLVRQLQVVTKHTGWTAAATTRREDQIHQSLLSGVLSNIGARDGNSKEFYGARNTKFLDRKSVV